MSVLRGLSELIPAVALIWSGFLFKSNHEGALFLAICATYIKAGLAGQGDRR